MRPLSLELQTIFGMPPIEHVKLAADLGCAHISAAVGPVPWKLDCFPDWSLRDDVQLQRDFIAVLKDTGVSISLAEGFAVRVQSDVTNYGGDLDLMASFGAKAVSSVCFEPDVSRAIDQYSALAEMIAERGMGLNIEFAPPHPINRVEKVLELIEKIDSDKARLLIDAMHFFRTGASIETLLAIDPAIIGYVQLSDAPLIPAHDNYLQEACFERMIPGEGELPLQKLFAVLPDSVVVGLEVPMRNRINNADDIRFVAAEAVTAAKRLMNLAK